MLQLLLTMSNVINRREAELIKGYYLKLNEGTDGRDKGWLTTQFVNQNNLVITFVGRMMNAMRTTLEEHQIIQGVDIEEIIPRKQLIEVWAFLVGDSGRLKRNNEEKKVKRAIKNITGVIVRGGIDDLSEKELSTAGEVGKLRGDLRDRIGV